jgi:hypothetical protein
MSTALSEEEVRAFVGEYADYYLQAWEPPLSGQGRALGFNIAVFLLCGWWLAYRKMYQAIFILAGVLILGTLLEFLLFVSLLKLREPPPGANLPFPLVVFIVVGICANSWYLGQARRVIAKVRARTSR